VGKKTEEDSRAAEVELESSGTSRPLDLVFDNPLFSFEKKWVFFIVRREGALRGGRRP